MRIQTKANFALIMAVATWGLTFPLIKDAVKTITPTTFVTLRLVIAFLILLPLIIKNIHLNTKRILIGGIILGLLNGLTFITQTIGLQTTSAANAAFITALSVIIVPFLAPVFKLGRPQLTDILSASVCLLGFFVLTGASLTDIVAGDFWLLGSAIAVALFIIVLQLATRKKFNLTLLLGYQILFGIPVPLFFNWTSATQNHFTSMAWISIIFCSAFATCGSFFLVSKYQRYTTITKAAIIYTFEPLFAALFGYLINHEPISRYTALGGGIIFCSFLLFETNFQRIAKGSYMRLTNKQKKDS